MVRLISALPYSTDPWAWYFKTAVTVRTERCPLFSVAPTIANEKQIPTNHRRIILYRQTEDAVATLSNITTEGDVHIWPLHCRPSTSHSCLPSLLSPIPKPPNADGDFSKDAFSLVIASHDQADTAEQNPSESSSQGIVWQEMYSRLPAELLKPSDVLADIADYSRGKALCRSLGQRLQLSWRGVSIANPEDRIYT